MSAERFVGLTYAEALTRELPPVQTLVDGLIEAGTVGTIVGLPETHKSFLALAVASKVATGNGTILGREVVAGGPVGYWWQDDSEARELARIQDYAARHGYGSEPVRWYLNEGLRLPEDIDALRAEVEHEQQVLVVLDSLYNFLHGVGLRDEEAAAVLARVKAEVCDPTGAAVLVVDHMAWPNETNRGQPRPYGSVFKTAASRWRICLDRDNQSLYVSASGNNISGLARTEALFDPSTHEVRLVGEEHMATCPSDSDKIADFLAKHPGATTGEIARGARVKDGTTRSLLRTDPRFRRVEPEAGRKHNAKCWALASLPVPDNGTGRDGQPAAQTAPSQSLDLPTPVGGSRDGQRPSTRPDESDGIVNGALRMGDEDFLPWLHARLEAGFITEGEWHEGDRAHRFVVAAREVA
jgi:KaiC/GvpD/RAD55 family RecA-like ATPase